LARISVKLASTFPAFHSLESLMANGATVRLPLAGEPVSTPAKAKPAAAPAATAIQIGTAMADAVEALGVALVEGGTPMRAETRTLNGEKLAAVVELQLAHFGETDDFRGLAQREGRRVLLERHAAGLRQQLGANVPEAAIARTFDELCICVVTVANQVAAIEAAFRTN
jgi:hypothetical protein